MTEKEQTLIGGCIAKQKAAWDSFVQQYSPLVYHTIKKTLSLYHRDGSVEAVEDLFQEFFVAILRDDCKKLRQFRGERGCTLASWVRLVTVRITIDFLRKREPDYVRISDDICSDYPDIAETLVSREQEVSFQEAIQLLPPRDRAILQLCFRENLPPQDIAGILKMSVNAVYTQKSRILDKLRGILEKTSSL
jgi:RNA polymerase sigma factor (sigma-70 family)